VSDIDTGVVDSLKALDPEWPIREADSTGRFMETHAPAPAARRNSDAPQRRRVELTNLPASYKPASQVTEDTTRIFQFCFRTIQVCPKDLAHA
jgi:hypothetical protein